MDQTGCSRIKVIGPSKDTSSKNREITETDARRNAAKGVCTRRVVGFARVGGSKGLTPLLPSSGWQGDKISGLLRFRKFK
jgi:hypothetical protein